jgi:hypothetical protein
MSELDLLTLSKHLSDRDLDVLRTLRAHRLATTRQLQRWHFTDGLATDATALRITQRALRRLEGHRLIGRLYQRIGGERRGADSLVWQLGVAGDRMLAMLNAEKRRRYVEPRRAFIEHTVAVTKLAVQLVEARRRGELVDLTLTGEPDNWQRFLGHHGQAEILKPDLTAVTASDEFEDHWMLELDQATEHPTVIVRKAQLYERFAASHTYQDTHGVVPAVLWIVPHEERRAQLDRALSRARGLTSGVHRVVLDSQFLPAVLAGSEPTTTIEEGRTTS